MKSYTQKEKEIKKIAFIQPFGLSSPGGGAATLRAFLRHAPKSFISICTSPKRPPETNIGKEIHLPVRPYFGRIESTRFGRYLGYLLPLYAKDFKIKLERICRENKVTAIHAIPHGLDFWYGFQVAQRLGLRYYLDVNDDMAYNLQSRPELKEAMECLAYVWPKAQRRIVVSEAMGREYCRRYGESSYYVISHGIEYIASEPLPYHPKSLRIYHMGSIHMSYEDNFKSLIRALEMLRQKYFDWTISLTCRPGPSFKLKTGSLSFRTLPWGSENEAIQDLKEADILYLPLPFDKRFTSFVKYSWSVRATTCLGFGLPILYHGPTHAAVGQLLAEYHAAKVVTSLDPRQIVEAIIKLKDETTIIVRNALELAHKQFFLSNQRDKFWKVLCFDK